MEWWKHTTEEIDNDPDLSEARRLAHYNTFMGSSDGREVLVYLKYLCHAVTADPAAMVARIELYNKIKAFCGCNVESDMAAVDAEANEVESEV